MSGSTALQILIERWFRSQKILIYFQNGNKYMVTSSKLYVFIVCQKKISKQDVPEVLNIHVNVNNKKIYFF